SKSPGSIFAPPMATTLALRGGWGGLARSELDLVREQNAAEAERKLAERRRQLEDRQRQLAELRAHLLGR
ncbi:MAG TPA: hypothetical protein VF469_30150, partial [Kofleriaceae bacterium]